MTDDTPALAIVIATHNGERKILRCLRSITSSDHRGLLQIVVVVDGSTDGTLAALEPVVTKEGARLQVHSIENSGPAAARNEGARFATAPWLLFLDDDTEAPPGFVDRVLALLEQPPADVLSFSDRPLESDGYVAKSQRYVELASRRILERELAIKGAAMACRREDFEELSGFAAHRRYYQNEDIDFVRRAKESGKRTAYLQKPFVYHESPRIADYVRKSSLALRNVDEASTAHYYRVKETLGLLILGGLVLAATRRRSLRAPLAIAAFVGAASLGALVARLAGAPLSFVPGILAAVALRLPFMAGGALVYLTRRAVRGND